MKKVDDYDSGDKRGESVCGTTVGDLFALDGNTVRFRYE